MLDWNLEDGDEESELFIDNAVVTEQRRGDDDGDWPSLDSLFGGDEGLEDLATEEWSGSLHRVDNPTSLPPSVHGVRNSFPELDDIGSPMSLDQIDRAFQDIPTKARIEPTVGAISLGAAPPRRSSRLQGSFKAASRPWRRTQASPRWRTSTWDP
ncbi:unnamed protein product [Tilletia caries]|uniref:Uncharacterized protein n=1 Tax=Tilletia caries TaxID=13290 RepID=A0ABN7ISI8_9BASI|nr:unnamed protein product [Tilletia caries]